MSLPGLDRGGEVAGIVDASAKRRTNEKGFGFRDSWGLEFTV